MDHIDLARGILLGIVIFWVVVGAIVHFGQLRSWTRRPRRRKHVIIPARKVKRHDWAPLPKRNRP